MKYQLLFSAAILLPLLSWQFIVNDIYSPLSWIKGADAKLQILYVINNPGIFFQIVWAELYLNFKEHLLQMGGYRLGWLDIYLPVAVIWMHLLALCILAYTLNCNYKLNVWQFVILLVTIMLGILLVETALYLHAQPVGSSQIIGIHGRYFLHLAFVCLLLVSAVKKIFQLKTNLQIGLIIVCCVSFITSVPIIISRFYV